jgi:hypothetical protein
MIFTTVFTTEDTEDTEDTEEELKLCVTLW